MQTQPRIVLNTAKAPSPRAESVDAPAKASAGAKTAAARTSAISFFMVLHPLGAMDAAPRSSSDEGSPRRVYGVGRWLIGGTPPIQSEIRDERLAHASMLSYDGLP